IMKTFKCVLSVLLVLFLIPTTQSDSTVIFAAGETNNRPVYLDTAESSGLLTYDELLLRIKDKDVSLLSDIENIPTHLPEGYGYKDIVRSLPLKNGNYVPKIHFYCIIAYSDHFWGIQEVAAAGFEGLSFQSGTSMRKRFSGNIQTWVREASTVEYLATGDCWSLVYPASESGYRWEWYCPVYEHGFLRLQK
ncbi:MAG: hypothetical protein IIZ48_03830, partial [Erysipelotrichales bacterium]|nr:hypothetical protein [Erysipelotrichales bacterium]